MCQFCVKHGDGKKWYLEARNYANDLWSDLRRREFTVDFVRNFADLARGLERKAEWTSTLPGPARAVLRWWTSRRYQRLHFGQPVPLEDCRRILDITSSAALIPCMCRELRGAKDEAYCMGFTTLPFGVAREIWHGCEAGPVAANGRPLTKSEAISFLRQCEDKGLIHAVFTFITPFIGGICNCSEAEGCVPLRLGNRYRQRLMWKGEYVASTKAEACTGCFECVGICPFGARELDRTTGKVRERLELCYGCGICRRPCPAGAIKLVPRREVPAVANDW